MIIIHGFIPTEETALSFFFDEHCKIRGIGEELSPWKAQLDCLQRLHQNLSLIKAYADQDSIDSFKVKCVYFRGC